MKINGMRIGLYTLSMLAFLPVSGTQADFKTAMDAYKAGSPVAARAVLQNASTPQEQTLLAHLLLRGFGGERDIPQGEALLRDAAMAGYAPAQSTLASMLATGGVLTKDETAAISWATRAAEQKRPEAMSLLAKLLHDRENTAAAMRWRTAAAAYGDAAALIALAKVDQAAGETEPKRLRSAYVRYSLAAAFAAQSYRRTNSESDALISHEAQAHRASLDLSLTDEQLKLGVEEANAELKAIVGRLRALRAK